MSSYIVNPQLGQNSTQFSQHMSTSMPIQSIITEKPSSMEYIQPSPRNHNGSVSSGGSIAISNNIQTELTQQPHQPQLPQKQQQLVPRAKKLVDKFATLSPRNMKNKSDRQLIVETAYCNWNGKKDSPQSDQRSNKMADNMKSSKKKKRAPINITEGMSRADIFAANVASAVDAAEGRVLPMLGELFVKHFVLTLTVTLAHLH
ncbi:11770_t:CDS:2 [Funneliformis geosporum]|uniref:720_t:CDS:1 n=1 Tax=Funneliformis geosporum TaxID=1117311 RepID=A0A9W4SC12_9GLOM|nr:11770_t:CDS:2 [Funneliformis geosporum]CAI2164245.1 720_t:CDS:2 [Funneliformis geosporum]